MLRNNDQRRLGADDSAVLAGPASRHTKPKRLRSGVFYLTFVVGCLVVFSVRNGGTAGMLFLLQACACLCVLWLVVWHLYLKHVPFLRNLATVLLNPYSEEQKQLAPRRRVTLDYGEEPAPDRDETSRQ